jgi:diguanylate cyclase (GGDEF)-like protein
VSIKVFYAVLLSVLATVIGLCLAWEFWLEDWLLPIFVSHHETESWEERWEFIWTVASFTFIALIVPTFIGVHMIRRDRALRQTMIRMSREDYLTGLYNRRRVTEVLENELQRAIRYDVTFSVTLMDVDNFKSINDEFGHQAGDVVLTKIANVVRSSVRATDIVGRWGGEEFVIISPGTDIGGGYSLAEKIRTQLEAADLGKIGHRTASFGVTAFARNDEIEDIIARVDAGLYKAKQGGRNRVEQVPAVTDDAPGVRPLNHRAGVRSSAS